MRNNLDSYRAFSAGKLEIVRNKIDKDLEKVEQNIENLEDKKNNTLEKISQIENTIESKIEKKIGKNPSENNNDTSSNIFIFIFYPICCYIGYNYVEGFDNIIGSIIIGFVIFIFGLPIVIFVLTTVFGGFVTIFGISLFKKEENYKENYNKIFNSEKRKIYKGKNKNLDSQLKRLEKNISELDDKYYFLQNLKKELPSLIRRARQREKTAKIAAFDKKTRDASDIVRKDLVRAVRDKKNWKCPYCNMKKNFSLHQTDHIHPVSKGGLAVPENMVPICKQCNQNKKALTLRVFCKKYGFDFNDVCERLEQQGKDI